ncbi:MAG: radical SAM protein [Spirochaetales bacterium]|nr:radical SAM protein [Spirochaetales bacterium]
MRVVLVQPSLEDFYTTPHRLSALGAFCVKSLLENQGHHVTLLNYPLVAKKPRPVKRPSWANHLEPFLLEERGPVSYFTGWYRWGLDTEEEARDILSHGPDLVLISLFAHAYSEEVLTLARACGKIPVAVGGAGVSVHPEPFVREPAVDLVLAGEGEVLFREYSLDDLLSRIGGDKLIRTSRYCTADEMVPVISETTGGRTHRQAATLLSRGCPRGCRFCSNSLTQGTSLRRLAPERIARAFRNYLAVPDPRGPRRLTLDLEDDNLLFSRDYLRDVLDRLSAEWQRAGRDSQDLFLTAENGLDYELLDGAFLEELADRGFRQFNFSLATADPGRLEQENRFFAPEKWRSHLAYLKEKGIPAITYFICGLKGDTREGIARTLQLIHREPTQMGISLFYPVPGLEGFSGSDPYGGVHPGLSRGSMAYPWSGALDTSALVTAFRLARLLNLMKNEREAVLHEDLILTILREKRLYTYGRDKKKIPVPMQDGDLVSLTLEGLTYPQTR